jgi:hypothetical protein
MTTIYLAQDPILSQNYYFVPDAETQAAGEALVIPNSIWSIGDIDAANAQLIAAQQNFQNTDQFKIHLSQVKCIGQDSDGYNIWGVCNITTEPSNTDSLYQLFCDVQPGFQDATGTDEALQIHEAQKQAVITWVGFRSIITLNELPKAPAQ